ncbi:MAG: hypothetical protein K8R57_01915 [Verrucomicrobia bacterium]|nr:hypothetical protein [Verrucomicrobiota bacterium]
MKQIIPTTILIGLSAMNGCSVSAPKHRAYNKSAAIKIPLTAVPEAVLASVDAHVPGIYLNEAHLTHQGKKEIYELEGLSQSATYEISATSNGHILDVDRDASLSD